MPGLVAGGTSWQCTTFVCRSSSGRGHPRTRHGYWPPPAPRADIEVVGRVSALLIGTFAVEMIFEGIGGWLEDPAPQWRA